ncbi:MAG: DMT family transporter [Treponema sp.]|nr:DMT family transporter [Treponema sp.]
MADKPKTILLAITAAALYALSTPFSKILMTQIPPSFMAGLLYLGAGLGMIPLCFAKTKTSGSAPRKITRKDFPYIAGMVALDIAAPILLMTALTKVSAANISLINNLEIVATSVIAFLIFKEKISARLWLGILLASAAGVILSFEGSDSLTFSPYSIFAFLACICWGFENNCTRKLSDCDTRKIVIIKGFGSGTGAILVALITREKINFSSFIFLAILLGFFAYGLSVFTYIQAQRFLGAARTSSYYAVSPFIGALLSIAIYREFPCISFCIAFIIMAAGTFVITKE